MKKFFKYLLTYLLGFITCLALIVGAGYWVYTSVNISTIESWTGSTIIDQDQIEEGAEVNLKTMSLDKLIREISAISSQGDTMTLTALMSRYGLKLPSDVTGVLPDKALTMPINKIFTEEGKNEILQNTNFEYLYSIIGQDAFAEPLKSVLANKTLDKVVAGDIEYILDGIKLGYVAGVNYEKQGDDWVAKYANPNEPTMVELLEGVAVDELIATFGEGGDILAVLAKGAGDKSLKQIIESITAGETMLGEDVTVSEFYSYDSTSGTYTLNLEALVGSMRLGHVMGYTPETKNGEIVGWQSGSEKLDVINSAIANIELKDVVSGNFDIMATVGEFYIGELLGYTPLYEGEDIVGWTDGESEIDEVIASFASAKIKDLINGTFNVGEKLKSIKVADVLGYTSTDYPIYIGGSQAQVSGNKVYHTVWAKGSTEANSMVSAIANKTIGELTNGISGYTIGKLAGYYEIGGKWYTLNKTNASGEIIYNATEVSGIMKYFTGLSIDALSSGASMESVINSVVIGDALGYVLVDGVWYVEYVSATENTPVEGVLESIVGLKIQDFKNGDAITNALQHVVVGAEMGYYEEDGIWYTDKTKTEKVTGILANIAGMTVGDLSNKDKIIEIVNQQSVGEMLGYYNDNGTWYTDSTKQTEVIGITKKIASMVVGDLAGAEGEIKDMSFGEIMGYHYDETLGWVDRDNVSHGRVMSLLCSKKVSELESTVDGLTIGEVFGEDEIEGTILSLIDKDTKIININTTLKSALIDATLGEYIELGILTDFSTEDKAKLDFWAPGWTELTIDEFLSELISNLPSPPSIP